jgi:hypothetical protein
MYHRINNQINRQINRQINLQINRQINRQIEAEIATAPGEVSISITCNGADLSLRATGT